MIEKNFDDMQDYFTAIIKISESGNEETLKAIRRIAIDMSNYFTDNFAEEENKHEVYRNISTEENA